MNTGGTPDIVIDEKTGLLSISPQELANDVRRLRGDADLRGRLGAAAARHIEATFDAPSVVARVEALYADLLAEARR
jgi:glycosyltransferase involved in cell wall biosynthesis